MPCLHLSILLRIGLITQSLISIPMRTKSITTIGTATANAVLYIKTSGSGKRYRRNRLYVDRTENVRWTEAAWGWCRHRLYVDWRERVRWMERRCWCELPDWRVRTRRKRGCMAWSTLKEVRSLRRWMRLAYWYRIIRLRCCICLKESNCKNNVKSQHSAQGSVELACDRYCSWLAQSQSLERPPIQCRAPLWNSIILTI